MKSLNFKLLCVCTGSIFIIFMSSLLMYFKASQEQEKVIRKEWFAHNVAMQESLGAQFFERYGDVQAFAQNSVL
ncbi:MAG: hypothetical protein NTX25_18380, partial [Proteobacteria bacterium]|nr:hypothetical protein [Pseudomonadota bacterium]